MKVLVPVSCKGSSETLFTVAERLLSDHPDAQVTILHVTKGSTSFYRRSPLGVEQTLPEPEREQVLALEGEVRRRFTPWYGRVQFRHAVGDPSAVILRVANTEGYDLIIMNRHNRGPVHLPVGTVSRAVVSEANCNVLLVR